MRVLRVGGQYRKNIIIFLLLASFPGIIFSFLLFFVSKGQMESELQSVHQNHLAYTIDTIQAQFSDSELLTANWAYNANKQDYSHIDLVQDYQKVRDTYNSLSMMSGYNPLIGRVEIYLQNPEPIVFTENGYTFLEDGEVEQYSRLLDHRQKMFWDHSLTSIEEGYKDRYASLVLVHNLDNYRTTPFGSVIVFLEKEKIQNLLQSPYEDGTSFILRDHDQWLFANEDQIEPEPIQYAVMKEILDQSDSMPFVFHYDNIKYTVTYDSFRRLGETWYYVSIAPMSNITAPVVFISKLFIYLNLLVFLAAIFLILFASKKLYAPIEKITRKISGDERGQSNEFNLIETHLDYLSMESEELHDRLSQQASHLREGFILQLIQGYLYAYREEDLHARLQQLGSDQSKKQYIICFVQLFGFNRLKGRFFDGDEGLVTFLAVNIAEDLIQSNKLEADVVNFHDLSLGILLSFTRTTSSDEIYDQVLQFSDELIQYINKICKMDVSVGVSRIAESLKNIHKYFEETKMSLSFRNLQEDNQIIEIQKIDSLLNRQDHYEYPFDLEKEITHAIRLRDQEAAVGSVREFFTVPAERSVSVGMMKQGALKLLGSIYHIMLQTGLIEDFAREGTNLYDELYRLGDPQEIGDWFEDRVIIPLIEELSDKQDQRLQLIAQKIIDLLEGQYMNDEISLEYCADEVNLNPSILSKVFKDITGWNFIDYLTNIRLMKAKELLIETDEKIKDVAEQTGYQHSYFNRIFKKSEGITPSEYRQMFRKNLIIGSRCPYA